MGFGWGGWEVESQALKVVVIHANFPLRFRSFVRVIGD